MILRRVLAQSQNSFCPNMKTPLNFAAAVLIFAVLPAGVLAQPAASDIIRPDRHSVAMPANPALPSLFLIGDSTVRNGQGNGGGGQWGWGDCNNRRRGQRAALEKSGVSALSAGTDGLLKLILQLLLDLPVDFVPLPQ